MPGCFVLDDVPVVISEAQGIDECEGSAGVWHGGYRGEDIVVGLYRRLKKI